MEEWRTITFIDGLQYYEVSNLGNVRSMTRDIETVLKIHGKEMKIKSRRNGRVLAVQYEKRKPLVILVDIWGKRHKLSVSLLVLRTFTKCPGIESDYVAGHLDDDPTNNKLDNLVWVSKASLMRNVSEGNFGHSNKDLIKYKNIIVKVRNQVVGYFKTMPEGAFLFNSYGFNTNNTAITNAFVKRGKFYYIFDLISVSDEEYSEITSKYEQINMKVLYDIIMADRHARKNIESAKAEKSKFNEDGSPVEVESKKVKVPKEKKSKVVEVKKKEVPKKQEVDQKEKDAFMFNLYKAMSKNKS